VASCCSVSQRAAVCCSVLSHAHIQSHQGDVAVCCSVLQCVAMCCSVLQYVCTSHLPRNRSLALPFSRTHTEPTRATLQCVAVCCSVLQRAEMCCSMFQCVAVCFSVLQCVAVCCSVLQCVAECIHFPLASQSLSCSPFLSHTYRTHQGNVVVCCIVLQYVAVCCSVYTLPTCLAREMTTIALALTASNQSLVLSFSHTHAETTRATLQCVAVCCSLLQCVAVCCSV